MDYPITPSPRLYEERHAQQKTAEGVKFEPLILNGVEVECGAPRNFIQNGAAFYIHGGGFVTGSVLLSRRINAHRDCSISDSIGRDHQKAYLQGSDSYDPLISSTYADLTGFPPMFIVVDGDEVLLGDSALLLAHAHRDGVKAELRITSSGLFHDFPSVGSELPKAEGVLEDTAAFLHRCGLRDRPENVIFKDRGIE